MSSNTDIQATVREMWETRPARPREDRKVAGVAAAVARRYDIDPVLVRIGFVVAAFYGVGIALYIAGWVALPEESDITPAKAGNGHHGRRHRRPHPGLIIGLVIAGIASTGALIGDGPPGLFALAVVGGLLFLLHRHRGEHSQRNRPVAASTADGAADAPAGAAARPADTSGGDSDESAPPRPQPPAWDPLGVAPFAWDLPEPSPAAAPAGRPARRSSRLTLITVGLALIAGGTAGGILLAGGDLAGLRVVLGVVLGVLGLGLVIGAFRQTGRGLILLAVPLIFLSYAVTTAPLNGWNGIGRVAATPTSAALVAPRYERSIGDVQLDLRQLDLATPAGADATPIVTSVDVGVGNAEVYLPPDADVQVHCSVGVGNTDCAGLGDDDRRGPSSDVRATDLGRDGKAGGRLIILDARAGVGNVEVHRG